MSRIINNDLSAYAQLVASEVLGNMHFDHTTQTNGQEDITDDGNQGPFYNPFEAIMGDVLEDVIKDALEPAVKLEANQDSDDGMQPVDGAAHAALQPDNDLFQGDAFHDIAYREQQGGVAVQQELEAQVKLEPLDDDFPLYNDGQPAMDLENHHNHVQIYDQMERVIEPVIKREGNDEVVPVNLIEQAIQPVIKREGDEDVPMNIIEQAIQPVFKREGGDEDVPMNLIEQAIQPVIKREGGDDDVPMNNIEHVIQPVIKHEDDNESVSVRNGVLPFIDRDDEDIEAKVELKDEEADVKMEDASDEDDIEQVPELAPLPPAYHQPANLQRPIPNLTIIATNGRITYITDNALRGFAQYGGANPIDVIENALRGAMDNLMGGLLDNVGNPLGGNLETPDERLLRKAKALIRYETQLSEQQKLMLAVILEEDLVKARQFKGLESEAERGRMVRGWLREFEARYL